MSISSSAESDPEGKFFESYLNGITKFLNEHEMKLQQHDLIYNINELRGLKKTLERTIVELDNWHAALLTNKPKNISSETISKAKYAYMLANSLVSEIEQQ